MRYIHLEKKNLNGFIDYLRRSGNLIAPVKKENQFVFAPITDTSEVCIDYIPTILAPKKYFFPQRQKLGSFKTGDVRLSDTSVDINKTILFGVHACDIEAIECLEAVFYEEPQDPYFSKIKNSIIIIGYECVKTCDKYATCVTMDTNNPKGGYDIMLTDAGDKYIVHMNSDQGYELVAKSPFFKKNGDVASIKSELIKIRKDKQKNFEVLLDAGYKEINRIFRESYDSKVWEGVGKKCLSCGNCTAVCPTCYCFDIYDEVKLDLTGGERNRMWDSCQLDEFATVAGGENFRKERYGRQRHRYYRKFDYPVRKHNKFFCVGCGRCTRTCMAKISLIETINALTKEYKDAKR
jgi:sulfhydrogenase subunit beta (sulfur reductase)